MREVVLVKTHGEWFWLQIMNPYFGYERSSFQINYRSSTYMIDILFYSLHLQIGFFTTKIRDVYI